MKKIYGVRYQSRNIIRILRFANEEAANNVANIFMDLHILDSQFIEDVYENVEEVIGGLPKEEDNGKKD